MDKIVTDYQYLLRGKTLTRDDADQMIAYINSCAPPVLETAPQTVFVISYDSGAHIGNAEKAAAEKLLGKVVWFTIEHGARPPQVSMFVKESK